MIKPQAHTKSKNKLLHTTAGEGFDDGSVIDILQGGNLILWNGEREQIAKSIRFCGQHFRAKPIADGLALPFPAESADYGSTADLFRTISNVFLRMGLDEEPASLLSYFVLSTWFCDLLPWIPSLLLHGEWADLLAIVGPLEAMCRRAMVLADFDRQCLSRIPLVYRPTVILVQHSLPDCVERLLANTLCPKGRMRVGDELVYFDCPRVMCCVKSEPDSPLEPGSLKLRISACRTNPEEPDIASRLQPQLQRYRLLNWKGVRDSVPSADQFTSNTREIAVALGRCFLADTELSRHLVCLLKVHDEECRSDRAYSKAAAVIDALLKFCSDDKLSVLVREVTVAAAMLLEGQGEADVGDRETGEVLRSLGFETKRKEKGFTLQLSEKTREKVHRLAKDYDVFSLNPGTHSCSTCNRASQPMLN